MSLNLGNDGVAAIRDLANDPRFHLVRAALWDRASAMVNVAIEAQPGTRDDVCGYARALRDVCVAFEAAATGKSAREVQKPGPRVRDGA
jgi:hypothetical protein